MKFAMRKMALVAAVGTAALVATPASAAYDVCTGSGQQCAPQTDTNVLLTGGTNLTTVQSNFNGSPTITGQFTSSTDAGKLNADASGQAVISSSDGALNALQYVTLNGITFTTVTFNLIGSGTVDIFGRRANGDVYSETGFVLGNGSNFFGIVATGGDVLTGFRFTSSGGVQDIRQVRLGGVGQVQAPVPEPSTWAMMLFGFGAMGFAMRRRRRANVLMQAA